MTLLLLGVVVLAAQVVQVVSGFGAMLLAVSLGGLILPVDALLPILVPLNAMQALALAIKLRARIDRRLLLLEILPLMAVGLLPGLWLAQRVQGGGLGRAVLGVLVVGLAVHGMLGRGAPSPRTSRVWMGAAGVVHGVFATGGPLLVHALARRQLPPDTFRGVLACVWLVLNATLFTTLLAGGRVDVHVATSVLVLLPLLPLGLWVGSRLAGRVDPVHFRTLIWRVLILNGALLIWRGAH